jgi:hypothetical protein
MPEPVPQAPPQALVAQSMDTRSRVNIGSIEVLTPPGDPTPRAQPASTPPPTRLDPTVFERLELSL